MITKVWNWLKESVYNYPNKKFWIILDIIVWITLVILCSLISDHNMNLLPFEDIKEELYILVCILLTYGDNKYLREEKELGLVIFSTFYTIAWNMLLIYLVYLLIF